MDYVGKHAMDSNFEDEPDTEIPSSIEFKTSEKKKEETVVPLIDGMSVETYPPTLIGGIGIFYKPSTGYISLRLHSLQFKENLDGFVQRNENGLAFMDPY